MRQMFPFGLPRDENGQALIETALTVTLLVLLIAAAIDFGSAFYKNIEVKGAARAGASYGATDPGDTTGMQNAAKAAAGDIMSDSMFSTTASWGCECYSGSTPTIPGPDSCTAPYCGENVVDYVSVTVSDQYTPLLPWPGIPSTISMSSTVTMRAGQ
ncbi:MAG TPA: TadE/TadG family type IV pilus assembly protein [Acidobacteriaceae bacterium]|nr:TadE/TadG family type IV pilus assembly protein [Acidobacteriaceae bacterium]